MKQVKMPAHLFETMIEAASKRIFNAKSIIIQDDGFYFKILTERFTGEIELAARATHPNPIQQTPTKPD